MKKTITIIAAMLMAVAASAQQTQPMPVDPAVRIGQLDNGLTYYIRHNEEPKGQANFYIAQKVGSILEEEDQRGLAHFLEHMCFNGTERFPGNGIIKYCESIGVKFGENLNAYTSIDETVYNIDNVPVAKVPSAIDSCLWILHDWADGLLLTDEDIDHERGVIHEEWRTRANAQIRQLEAILPVLYPDNRYGQRMPIGVMEVVDNFPYKVLRDYYEKWYRPDQQGVIVVGDIDVDAIEAKIKDIFGTIAAPVNPAERTYFEIADNKEPIICMTKDKEQPYAMTYIFCKHDPYPVEMRTDLNYYIYQYALSAATIMVNSRLQEITNKPNPPFIQAQISDGEYLIAKTKYGWQGIAISSETDLAKAVTSVYREMLRATRCGFTASEYERTKARILANVEDAYNSRDKRKSADFCSEYVRHFIDKEPIPGIETEYALFQQIAPAISVEVVNQIVASLVGEGNLAMCSMLPDKEGVVYPTESEMASLLAAVEAEDIQPYEDEVSDQPLLAEIPQAGKVVKTKESYLGYTQYTLSNGATVYFKQTDINPNEILMSASSYGGTTFYPVSESANLKALNDVISISGIGEFKKTDLNKVLAGKKVSVHPYVGTFMETMSASSTPKDLETMFQLNYLYFTDMRADDEAFESWIGRQAASLANIESDPMSALQDSLRSTIYNNPARVQSMKVKDLESVDYQKVLSIAKERYANAADFDFVITGAVDEETLIPLLETYIASLPSTGKKEKANLKALDFSKGNKENKFDREMEVPMVTNFFFDFSKCKYNLKNYLAFNLGCDALSVVLLEEIREKEGGTYGIGAYGSMSGSPKPRKQANMQISYQTDPARYEYLNQRVREIVDQFAKEGPSEENLAKGKEFLHKKHLENINENSWWAESLEEILATGVDMTEDYDKVLDSITAEDVRKAVASMLKKDNHSEVIMVGVKK